MEIVRPMLAETATTKQVEQLLENPGWALSQKLDGKRCLPHIENGNVRFLSRNGLGMKVSKEVEEAIGGAFSTGRWVLDGEYLDDTLWLFDLIIANDKLDQQTPYGVRRDSLVMLVNMLNLPPAVQVIPSFTGTFDKSSVGVQLKEAKAEGFMLRDIHAGYHLGRSKSLLKVKFIKEVDCVVSRLTPDKSSFTVAVWNGENFVSVADVTALSAEGSKVQVGDVVVVQCLYVTNDNRLYQPTRPRIRTDKTPYECTWDQLDALKTNKEVLV